MMDRMHRLFRKRVEILANGIIYRGEFLGADEELVYLIGPTSYLTIPMELVAAVREEGGEEGDWLRREVEGEPRRKPEEIEEKRRFSREALPRLLPLASPEEWPEKKPAPEPLEPSPPPEEKDSPTE